MEVLHYRLDPELEWLGVVPIADIHVGDPAFREDLFTAVLRWVEANRHWVRIVLNGDVLNVATKNSKSDVYKSRMTPQEELDWAVEALYPFRDLILCVNTGNHEERISRDVGIDVSKELAERLDVPYSGSGAQIVLNVGKNRHGKPESYVIYATHGTGGGKRVGSKANNLELTPLIVEGADLYIWSHLHQTLYFANRTFRADARSRKALDRHRHHIISCSFLDHGYAERLGLVPSPFVLPIALFCGRERGVTVVNAELGVLARLPLTC